MEDYSEPTIWNEFLKRHDLDAGTPTPDKSLCAEVSDMPEETLTEFLIDYAHLNGSSWRHQRSRMEAHLDRLVESGDDAP